MENNEVLDLLREQNGLLKKQLNRSRLLIIILVVLALVAVAAFVVLVPKMTAMTQQIQESMAELDAITRQLDSVDLAGNLENVNGLVVACQEYLGDTMEKLNGMDFEGLNQAITTLSDLTSGMSYWFR